MRIPRHWLLVLAAAAVHLAALLPLIGSESFILDNVFRPYVEGVLAGSTPYGSLGFEYPPGAVPVLVLPGLISSTAEHYRTAFDAWMLVWDLGILAVLGLALSTDLRKLTVALVIYSLGLLVLGRLVLARFDLVPAALSLTALVLYQRKKGFDWGLALGAGAVVKAWTVALLPVFLLGERRRYMAIAGFALPVVVGVVAVWSIFGEGPGTAFAYHTDRGLQIESLAASLFLIAAKLGLVEVDATFGSGSFNIAASGASLAKTLSIVLLIAGYLALLLLIYVKQIKTDLAVTLITGWLIVIAPVLSPQFLIWILPLAAIAYANHWQLFLAKAAAITLVVTSLLTRLAMENYDQISFLGDDFVASIFTRNLVFVAWLVLTLLLALNTRTPSSAKISR